MEIKTTTQRTPTGRAQRGRWLSAFLGAVMLVLLAVVPVSAGTQTLVPACAGANLRTSPSTGASVKTSLGVANTLTVSGTVSGSSWSANCPARTSGSAWYKITHVNGQSVSTLYRVAALYAATGVLTLTPTGAVPASLSAPTPPAAPAAPAAPVPTPIPATQPSTTTPVADGAAYVPACSGVNLRTSASTSGSIKASLGLGSAVTVAATVTGASWSTRCPTAKAASTWYRISHVNGQPVGVLFGAAVLYAATGVLNPGPASLPAAPAVPAPTQPTSNVTLASTVTLLPTPEPTVPPTPAPTPVPPSAQTAVAGPVAPLAPTDPSAANVLVPACGGVNLRAAASTGAAIKVKLGFNDLVAVSGTVSGGSWSAACPSATSGSGWYAISHVNGQPVATLYGVPSLYAATSVLTAPATAASAGVTTLGGATTFYGRGYGHGVGLSQYGARGRALAGQTAPEILAHYFAGTTIGSISVDTQIRALLLDNFVPSSTTPLTIYGRGGTWAADGVNLVLPANAKLRVFPPTSLSGWRALIEAATGEVLYDGPIASDFRLNPTSDTTTIQLYSKPSIYDLYRGSLRLLMSGFTLDVINQLTLESYLRGVVPAEMPTSWPAEARIAQTIVARSFAANHLLTRGTFDVYDDTRSQVYLGVRKEHPDADALIAATAGQVIMSGSAIANAMFSSTAGGATEHNENVFVSPTGAKIAGVVSYLRGSSDRDASGVSYDAAAPYATWQSKSYDVAQLSSYFANDARTNVGTIIALDLRNRGVSGRLVSVTLIGSAGTRTVSGSVFIGVFNAYRPSADPILRSTLVHVAPIP